MRQPNQKKKKNIKAKAVDKPNFTYTQNLDAQSEVQAELVLAAAGVEMYESLQDKVNKTMGLEEEADQEEADAMVAQN